jgi:hypothetical protein
VVEKDVHLEVTHVLEKDYQLKVIELVLKLTLVISIL